MQKSLTDALRVIGKTKRQELESIIREAGIAEELGGNMKLHLLKEAKNHKGVFKTLLKSVAGCNRQDLDEISHIMSLEREKLDDYVPRWQRQNHHN